MNKEEETKWDEQIREFLIGDISPDAGLSEIKGKQAEIISKQRIGTVSFLKRRKELLDLERLEMAAYSYHCERVMEGNRNATSTTRLNKEDKERRIRFLVDHDEGRKTVGIYDKIAVARNNVSNYETILKNNKMIADRVENMLNAQINLDRQIQAGKQER